MFPLQEVANDSGVAPVSYALSDYVAQVGELRQPTCDEWDEYCVEPEERGKQERRSGYADSPRFGAFDGVLAHWYRRLTTPRTPAGRRLERFPEMGRGARGRRPGLSSSSNSPPPRLVTDANAVTDVKALRVVEMVADPIVFSPWWCALFLGAMADDALRERRRAQRAGSGARRRRRLRSS